MNDKVIHKTSKYFKKKGVVLPQISELQNPHSINDEIKSQLKSLDKDAMDPLNLYDKNTLTNAISNIMLTGPLKNVGLFRLESDKKLRDLIIAAGGFRDGVTKVKISVSRRSENSKFPIIYNFTN